MPCLLCHRRESNPRNQPCPEKITTRLALVVMRLFLPVVSGPICTICHADVQAGTISAFPSLRSFGSRFDHALHNSVGAKCSSCHRPTNRGVALTIPIGVSAHNACFGCHAPQAKVNGRDISSCGVCHRPEPLVRASTQSVAFRRGFSHARHDSSGCLDCHKVRARQSQQNEVTAPIALHHHAPARGFSCLTCHDGKRAFGGDDFSVCTRCHKGSNWRF